MSPGAAGRHAARLLAILGASLALTACGFHLRGRVDLPAPMARTYIAGANDTLADALSQDLLVSGAQVVPSETQASAVLKISGYHCDQFVQSLTAAGQVSGYRLVCALDFSARATHGQWRLPRQHLWAQRNYSYSVSQVLAKSDEARRLRADMDRELAQLIMLRLQAAAHGSGAAAAR